MQQDKNEGLMEGKDKEEHNVDKGEHSAPAT